MESHSADFNKLPLDMIEQILEQTHSLKDYNNLSSVNKAARIKSKKGMDVIEKFYRFYNYIHESLSYSGLSQYMMINMLKTGIITELLVNFNINRSQDKHNLIKNSVVIVYENTRTVAPLVNNVVHGEVKVYNKDVLTASINVVNGYLDGLVSVATDRNEMMSFMFKHGVISGFFNDDYLSYTKGKRIKLFGGGMTINNKTIMASDIVPLSINNTEEFDLIFDSVKAMTITLPHSVVHVTYMYSYPIHVCEVD